MMIKKLFLGLALACVAAAPARAQGATLTFSIIINSPPSTAITCAPIAPWTLSGTSLSYPATSPEPVPAGAGICTLTIAPSTWSGALALSGTNAQSFALNGLELTVGSAALAAGNYAVTITSTP